MSFDEKESLSDRLKMELDKKKPDRGTVIQILKEIKKEETGGEQTDPVLEMYGKKPQKEEKPNRSSVWKRVAVAAVVCLVVLASVPNVFGCESVFTMIGQWTKEIFSFGKPSDKDFVYQTDHPGLQELYDEVAKLELSRNVVPTWLPENAVKDQIYTQTTAIGTMVYAGFTGNGNHIGIQLYVFNELPDTEYQKGRDDAILYEREGVKHYILENLERWTATWIVDNTECMICADSKEVVYKMLKSIYFYSLEE